MSGGSRNYVCFKIDDDLCGKMYDAELNDLMEDISKLAHDVEWYDSGDTGIEDYRKSVAEFKEKWFRGNRQERLKGYIDKELEETRKRLYSLIGEEV